MSVIRSIAVMAVVARVVWGAEPLPQTMAAAAIDRGGGPEVLTVRHLPVPKPDAGEVLIALNTVGVGPWDVHIREHPDAEGGRGFPRILGVDGAGRVAEVGSAVHGFKVGDPVYSYVWNNVHGGFYAQYVAVPASAVGHIPKGVDLKSAGAMAVSALTAIQGVDDALHVKQGETLIIHGASGGVGSLAIQFAKLRGARVFATASGDDGVSFVKRLGADAAIDGRKGDIRAAVREFAPGGVDAVLALAGGEALEACIDQLRPGGRMAYPGGVSAPKARAGLSPVEYDALTGPQQYTRLNQAIVASKLEVPIAAEFPLSDAAGAHRAMEAGHVLGKIVLRVY